MATDKTSLYEKQAKAILDLIESSEDKLVWHKPWLYVNVLPRSAASEKEYTGRVNTFILLLTQEIKGWGDCPYWATFNWIVNKNGGHVKKDEKSTMIFYPIYKDVPTGEKDENGDPILESRFQRYSVYTVFNVKYQTTGLEEWVAEHTIKQEERKIDVSQSVEKLEKIYLSIKDRPSIKHNGQKAYYRPSDDTIGLPKFDSFETNLSYWKTKYHELAHSTGKKERCNRKEVTEQKDIVANSYDREELVAEFATMNILAFAGYVNQDVEEHAAAYIQGWMKAFKEKPSIIQEAIKDSITATEWLLKDYKEG